MVGQMWGRTASAGARHCTRLDRDDRYGLPEVVTVCHQERARTGPAAVS